MRVLISVPGAEIKAKLGVYVLYIYSTLWKVNPNIAKIPDAVRKYLNLRASQDLRITVARPNSTDLTDND